MNTTITRIRITGCAADAIARLTAQIHPGRFWTPIQSVDACDHACTLYARRRGAITQYELFHNKSYGCPLGSQPETRNIPVSVAPKSA